MITVSISINGQPIYTRSAVNVTEEAGGKYGKGKQVYRMDTGEILINHKTEDGAIKLACRMLETIKEI